jgi:hypothetical protein
MKLHGRILHTALVQWIRSVFQKGLVLTEDGVRFKALCQTENFERRRRSSNMEIMILQGARAAHGDAEAWRHGMRMIDMICRDLFGGTRFFQRPGQDCLNVEHDKIQHQIQNVIRLPA